MVQYKHIFRKSEKEKREPLGNPTLFELIKHIDVFYIPDFQRFFRWDTKNISQLIKDIEKSIKNKTELFFGNMLFKEKGKNDLEVIDGQQRIVSFLILLRTLVDSKKKIRDDIKKEFESILENTTITQITEGKVKLLKPIHDFFKEFILEGKEFSKKISELEEPKKNIISAKRKFKNYIEKQKEKDANTLANFLKKSIRVVVIYIEINEYEIYDSINSKGVPLTDADKIKNLLYKEADESEIEKVKKIWCEMFEMFNFSSKALSKFLKTYWITNEEKAGTTFYKKFYKKFYDEKGNSTKVSKDILKYAKIYKEISKEEPRLDYWGKRKYGMQIVDVLKTMQFLGITTSYIIFMQLRATFNKTFEKRGNLIKDMRDVFQDIEKLSFLHINLFGQYPQRLKNIFSSWSIKFRKGRGSRKILKKFKKELRDRINPFLERYSLEDRIRYCGRSTDKPFGFSSRELAYMLLKIMKSKMRSNTIKRNLKDCEDKTIEHIMPKKYITYWELDIKKYIKDWLEYKNRKEDERVEMYVKLYLNDLGNLGLLDSITNSELGNKSFKEKKKILNEKEADNKLFEDVISGKEWSFKEIEERRKKLCRILKNEIFKPNVR